MTIFSVQALWESGTQTCNFLTTYFSFTTFLKNLQKQPRNRQINKTKKEGDTFKFTRSDSWTPVPLKQPLWRMELHNATYIPSIKHAFVHLYVTKSWKSWKRLVFYPLIAFAVDPASVPNAYVVAHSQRTQGRLLVFKPFPSPGSLHTFPMPYPTDTHMCLFLHPSESLHLFVLCIFPKIGVDARYGR